MASFARGVGSRELPDVVPSGFLIPGNEMPWGPVEPTNGLQARSRLVQPTLSGAALGLWLKFADRHRTGFIMRGPGRDRFTGQLGYLRHTILTTRVDDTQPESSDQVSGHHIMRTVGRVMLHEDRHKLWSLPLGLQHEEQMIPRPGSRVFRVEEFTSIAHDLAMNLPAYIQMAKQDAHTA